jgi:2-oxoacid:acceptor oxidoreductase gamma subunit (pyruvate/2-ketoisovalerate family)
VSIYNLSILFLRRYNIEVIKNTLILRCPATKGKQNLFSGIGYTPIQGGPELMIEIRFHGRGGQGAVTGANILAMAAFREGKDVQAFPYFGVERRGAPVTAFTKIDNRPVRVKSQIYEPDYVVVLDASLLKAVEVDQGLKKNGIVIINSDKQPEDIKGIAGRVATVDATQIAVKHGLGTKEAPIVNTAILGALAKATGIVRIDSIVESILESAPAKKNENAEAAREAHDRVIVGGE